MIFKSDAMAKRGKKYYIKSIGKRLALYGMEVVDSNSTIKISLVDSGCLCINKIHIHNNGLKRTLSSIKENSSCDNNRLKIIEAIERLLMTDTGFIDLFRRME